MLAIASMPNARGIRFFIRAAALLSGAHALFG
jgi:hypothetical protein